MKDEMLYAFQLLCITFKCSFLESKWAQEEFRQFFGILSRLRLVAILAGSLLYDFVSL